ncbi:MAG: hypothetical protein AAFR38_05720 [Planctomycetota bacterium]
MSRRIATVLAAGSTLGLGGFAQAQTAASLDLDRAYAAELAADAAQRASAAAADESAGFDIAGKDGATLNIGALVQFRYTANFRDEDAAGVGSSGDFTHGFEIPRAQLRFSGNVINDRIRYYIEGDFGEVNSAENDFQIEDAWIEYDFAGSLEGVTVRAGQFKLPLIYEELVHPEYSQTVDRSVANEVFSQQRSQGIQFAYTSDAWRAMVAVSDGLATGGSGFAGAEADIALTGRFDYKFEGDWDAFNDFSSFQTDEAAYRVGAALHWETWGDTNNAAAGGLASAPLGTLSGTTDGQLIAYTFDAQLEFGGWNFYGAFLGSYVDSDASTAGAAGVGEFNDFGVVAQAGYFVTEQVELFARYDGVFVDDERAGFSGAGAEDNFNFVTFGGTYFFVPESHALKFTTDVVISIDETASLSGAGLGGSSSITGILGQAEEPEIAVRAQLQLVF